MSMLPLRTRLFIIISLVVLVVLGIILVVWALHRQKNGGTTTTQTTNHVIDKSTFSSSSLPMPGLEPTQVPPAAQSAPVTTDAEDQNAAKQLARIFIERYNSYSSDNNFSNIKDVQALVTPSLWSRISGRLSTVTTATSSYGVTTDVITMTLSNWSTTSSTVAMKVRRTLEQNGVSTEKYQNSIVQLLKQNGNWLVDSYTTK